MTTDHIVRSGYLSEDLADSDAENMDDMYDENSSARLFERQRIKALAGKFLVFVSLSFENLIFEKVDYLDFNFSCNLILWS